MAVCVIVCSRMCVSGCGSRWVAGADEVRLVNPEILGSLEHVGRAPSLSARPDHRDLQ